MKQLVLFSAGLALASSGWLAASASGKVVELGQTSTAIAAPQCPKGVPLNQCAIVLEHTTALQTASDRKSNPTRVTKPGWIVAFSVGLSNLTSDAATEKSLLHGLDTRFGGTPQVALTVLRPGPKNSYTVVAESPAYHLIPFLGTVLQEPLSLPPSFSTLTALPVKAGDVIGLTIPTWAPVLSYDLTPSAFSYRQSRTANCTTHAATQTAQLKVGASQRYLCSYTGARVQYTATEVVNTPYPKSYVGGPTTPTKK